MHSLQELEDGMNVHRLLRELTRLSKHEIEGAEGCYRQNEHEVTIRMLVVDAFSTSSGVGPSSRNAPSSAR